MADHPQPTLPPSEPLPDERPQRRREYSGAGSTLGVAALIIVAVGLAIWWFELRGDSGGGSADDGLGVVPLDDAQNPTGKSPAAEVGRAAPNFMLRDLDGANARLTDYRGKFVLVNFWASWCGPCRGEVPDLEALAQRQPANLVVVGVNQQETRDAAAKFVADFDISYPILLDRSGEVSQAYRLGGLPVTYLVNPQGIVLHAFRGRITADQIADLEREYLSP